MIRRRPVLLGPLVALLLVAQAFGATLTPTTNNLRPGVQEVKWTLLANGDSGDWMTFPDLADKTVQVSGTFGAGGTVSIQGTNHSDNSNALILHATDAAGTALTFTGADIKVILENPGRIRPTVTAGDATTSLTVIIIARGK